MGYRTMQSVFELSKSKGTDRLVLLAIAEHANDKTGCCWPAVETIAAKANIQSRAVKYALKTLQELGELTVQLHGAPGSGPRQYRPNLYRITLSGAHLCTTEGPLVVHDDAPLDDGPVVHETVSSGARDGHPVVHGGAPKPEKNQKNHQRSDPITAKVEAFADAWVRHAAERDDVKNPAGLRRWVLKVWGDWARERFEVNPGYRPTQLVDKAKQLGSPDMIEIKPLRDPELSWNVANRQTRELREAQMAAMEEGPQ